MKLILVVIFVSLLVSIEASENSKLGDVLKNHTRAIYNTSKNQDREEENLLKQETHKLLSECGVDNSDSYGDYDNRRNSNRPKKNSYDMDNSRRRNNNKRYNSNESNEYGNGYNRYNNRNRNSNYDNESEESNSNESNRNSNRRRKNNNNRRYGNKRNDNNNNNNNNENYSDEEDSNESEQSNKNRNNGMRRYNRTMSQSNNRAYYSNGYSNNNGHSNGFNNDNGNYGNSAYNNDCRDDNHNQWKSFSGNEGNYGYDNQNYGYGYANNGNPRRGVSGPGYARNFDINLRAKRSNNDDDQCVSQCVFGYLEVLDDSRVPSETLVVKWLQDHLSNDMKRIRALREARRCFARLSTSDIEDGCEFSQSLSKCLNLELE